MIGAIYVYRRYFHERIDGTAAHPIDKPRDRAERFARFMSFKDLPPGEYGGDAEAPPPPPGTAEPKGPPPPFKVRRKAAKKVKRGRPAPPPSARAARASIALLEGGPAEPKDGTVGSKGWNPWTRDTPAEGPSTPWAGPPKKHRPKYGHTRHGRKKRGKHHGKHHGEHEHAGVWSQLSAKMAKTAASGGGGGGGDRDGAAAPIFLPLTMHSDGGGDGTTTPTKAAGKTALTPGTPAYNEWKGTR